MIDLWYTVSIAAFLVPFLIKSELSMRFQGTHPMNAIHRNLNKKTSKSIQKCFLALKPNFFNTQCVEYNLYLIWWNWLSIFFQVNSLWFSGISFQNVNNVWQGPDNIDSFYVSVA